MKIAILTQPLRINYGGILQAFALQTVLKRMGHEVIVVNREYNDYETYKNTNIPKISFGLFLLRLFSILKTFIRILLGNREYVVMSPFSGRYSVLWKGYTVLPFVKNNINRSKEIRYSLVLSKYLQNNKFDCIIVGSDQVWRPKYSPCLTDFFLKGIKDETKIKKIGYAVSFGTDKWEYTYDETKECTQLVKKFDAISVREQSAVKLCKENFGIDAIHLLDPTLLLDIDHYIALALSKGTVPSDGNMLCYVLDMNKDIENMIHQLQLENENLIAFNISMEVKPTKDNPRPLQKSVEQWLRGFYDAKYIVTDSFHACVFSILFKKPFVVWGNKSRGMSRFESLLGMFGLEKRIITSYEDFERRKHELLNAIDYEPVMDKLIHMRKKSFYFFEKNGLI